MLRYQGLILFFLTAHYTYSVSAIPKIKVKLASSLEKVTLSGFDLEGSIPLVNKKRFYKGKRTLRFNCSPVVSSLKTKKAVLKLASINSKTGFVSWKKESYRGDMNLILSKKNKNCTLINELSIEKYISSLLAKEMSANWPLEALKAQAVAARSYAYHKIKSKQLAKDHGHDPLYHLESSQKHQVSGSVDDETFATNKAAIETKGEVLSAASGKMTPIFFHSKCGGHTLRPEQVWANKVEGYQSVKCPYCHKHGTKKWRTKVSSFELVNLIDETLKGYHSEKIIALNKKIRIVSDKRKSSFLKIYDDDELKFVKKSRLRVKLGYNTALSNNYKIHQESNGELFLKGEGRGHGVGMCQFGAYEMAKRGMSYKQILKHYFPNHRLKVAYK